MVLSYTFNLSKGNWQNKAKSLLDIHTSYSKDLVIKKYLSLFKSYQQPSVGQPVNAKSSQRANAKPTPSTPDHEIQGSKEALIQDLERKLKCKDSLLHNGNQVSKMSFYKKPIRL